MPHIRDRRGICLPTVAFAPTPAYRRVMIFIDGGYLRRNFENIYEHQRIDFAGLYVLLKNFAVEEHRRPELIRVYYYDSRADPEENLEEYKKQNEYFSGIEEHAVYEVKLARIRKAGKEGEKKKQKGTDVLLAVDMITKALMDHFDVAILLAGDDDLLDLVRAVKDFTDKRVYGAFYPGHISEALRRAYDKKLQLTKELLDKNKIAKG